jgi:3-keto-L-gulonate-6-phosphate decarboxylase
MQPGFFDNLRPEALTAISEQHRLMLIAKMTVFASLKARRATFWDAIHPFSFALRSSELALELLREPVPGITERDVAVAISSVIHDPRLADIKRIGQIAVSNVAGGERSFVNKIVELAQKIGPHWPNDLQAPVLEVLRGTNGLDAVAALLTWMTRGDVTAARILAGATGELVRLLPEEFPELQEKLLTHQSWFVRAATINSLAMQGGASATKLFTRMLDDVDYKVRATVSRQAATMPVDDAIVEQIKGDTNWHVVREFVANFSENNKVTTLVSLLNYCTKLGMPDDILATGVERLCIAGVGDLEKWGEPALTKARRSIALKSLPRLDSLALEFKKDEVIALLSARWGDNLKFGRRTLLKRFLLERIRLQVALDLVNIDRAASIAKQAADGGADLIEVGDPLIKANGVDAIRVIGRSAQPVIVAEMMASDWGQNQVRHAAECGADIVLLGGIASLAGIGAAAATAREYDVLLLVDVPVTPQLELWCEQAELVGADGFILTTNIDVATGVPSIESALGRLRSCTTLPVGVTGGFELHELDRFGGSPPDVFIVGRGIVDSRNVEVRTRQYLTRVQQLTSS